jgi:hypothetical protein
MADVISAQTIISSLFLRAHAAHAHETNPAVTVLLAGRPLRGAEPPECKVDRILTSLGLTLGQIDDSYPQFSSLFHHRRPFMMSCRRRRPSVQLQSSVTLLTAAGSF